MNFLLRVSISLSTHLGKTKKDRKYMGMDDNTALIMVIPSPMDSILLSNQSVSSESYQSMVSIEVC